MQIGLAVLVLLVLAVFALCAFALMPRAEAQPPARSLEELVFADDPLEKSAELGHGEKPPADTPVIQALARQTDGDGKSGGG